jgi:hypothetical protein
MKAAPEVYQLSTHKSLADNADDGHVISNESITKGTAWHMSIADCK